MKMQNLSLYTIADQYVQAFMKLADGDMPDDVIDDTLESLEGEFTDKSTQVAMFIRNLEASAEAIKQAEAEMAKRRKATEARAERIRAYLKSNMERVGVNKIESAWFNLVIKKNPPAVVIDAEDSIPDDYWKQPETPPLCIDKKLIAQAIKDGFIVPGAHLQTGTRLDIK
jgi:hypothetical protein